MEQLRRNLLCRTAWMAWSGGVEGAAEAVAESVEAQVEHVEAAAETAIEAAEERAEAAEAVAEAVADSARHSAVVQQVETHHEDMDAWRGQMHGELSGLRETVTAQGAILADLPRLISEAVTGSLQALNPTPSTPEPTPSSPLNPADAVADEPAPAVSAEPPAEPPKPSPVASLARKLRRAL